MALRFRFIPYFLFSALCSLVIPAHASAGRTEPASDTLIVTEPGEALQLSGRFVLEDGFSLLCRGHPLSGSLYRLEPVPGRVIPLSPLPCDTLVANYRWISGLTLPQSFSIRDSFPVFDAADSLAGVSTPSPSDSTMSAPVKNSGAARPPRVSGWPGSISPAPRAFLSPAAAGSAAPRWTRI